MVLFYRKGAKDAKGRKEGIAEELDRMNRIDEMDTAGRGDMTAALCPSQGIEYCRLCGRFGSLSHPVDPDHPVKNSLFSPCGPSRPLRPLR
jgi:hypothetical protein